MPLALDDRKMLPHGVHDGSLAEVEELFGRFQKSDRRVRVFEKLENYLEAIKKAIPGASVIIDGSFVMACVHEPEDVDLIVALPPDWDWAADLKPRQYNLLSKRRVKKNYGIDVFPVALGSNDEQKWILFFHQVNTKWSQRFGWPVDSTKGLVRVTL